MIIALLAKVFTGVATNAGSTDILDLLTRCMWEERGALVGTVTARFGMEKWWRIARKYEIIELI